MAWRHQLRGTADSEEPSSPRGMKRQPLPEIGMVRKREMVTPEFSVAVEAGVLEALEIKAGEKMDAGMDDSEGASVRDEEDRRGAGASGFELAT